MGDRGAQGAKQMGAKVPRGDLPVPPLHTGGMGGTMAPLIPRAPGLAWGLPPGAGLNRYSVQEQRGEEGGGWLLVSEETVSAFLGATRGLSVKCEQEVRQTGKGPFGGGWGFAGRWLRGCPPPPREWNIFQRPPSTETL